jgi:hypothetical protein
MKIETHYSLIVADKVIKHLDKLLENIDCNDNITKHCWSNGREQGYSLHLYMGIKNNFIFNIAQQRSSDGILIIYGNMLDFNITTNQPNDNIWVNNRKDFSYNEILQAAEFICDMIKEMILKDKIKTI